MSKGSIITLIVVVVFLVGGLLSWKAVQRSRAEAEARQAPFTLLAHTKVYKENKEYLDRLIAEAHAPAFGACYKFGGLLSPSEWDEQAYIERVFDHVADRARADNKADIIPQLPGVHGKAPGHVERSFSGGAEGG